MRKNKSKLMAFSLLALCLACLGFGVYALKNATLTVTGTVGFTAHDCLVNVMAEIEGDGVDTNNVPNSNGAPSEKRDLIINKTENSNEMIVGGATADDWNKEAEIAETIWFTDLTEDGSVSEIVMTFTLTNQSAYSITASLSNAEIANVRVGASEEITLSAGAEGVLTATFNLDLNADGEYPEINSLPFEVKLDFRKVAPGLQPPKNVSIENDILTFTPVEGATGYEVAFFTEGQTEPIYVYTTTESGQALKKPEELGNYIVKVRAVLTEDGETTYSDYREIGETTREYCQHLEFTPCTLEAVIDENSTEAYAVTGIGTCTDDTVIVPATYNGKPVISIYDYAFNSYYNNVNFTKIILPENIQYIGQSAFVGCPVKDIVIPSTLKKVSSGGFGESSPNTSKITNIYITDMEKWCSITFDDWAANPLYYATNLYLNNQIVTDIVIPGTITKIPSLSFCNYSKLETVKISEGVQEIGQSAFNLCTGLKSVEFPSSLKIVGKYAFESCELLGDVKTQAGIEQINEYAFSKCSSLSFLDLHSTVKSIGKYAFQYCSNLKQITIPNEVKYINEYTFYNCSLLETVNLSNQLINIGKFAFSGCSSLETVLLYEGLTTIERRAFSNCSSLNSLTLPTTLTTIKEEAFLSCSIDNIYISDMEKWLLINFEKNNSNPLYYGDKLYLNDVLVETVTIQNSCTNIPKTIFANYKYLKTLIIAEGVETIGESAFSSCINLENVTIPTSITDIGKSAFYKCEKLETVEIPAQITILNNYVFGYCNSLNEVKLPSSLLTISDNAFYSCVGLQEISLPEGITSIGANAFNRCDLLEIINLPTTLLEIGNYAFSKCINLENIVIPNNVTTLGDGVFSSCENLTTLIIPENVTKIGQKIFNMCKNITDVVILSKSLTIDGSFEGTIYSINSLKIFYNGTNSEFSNSVTLIGTNNFSTKLYYYYENEADVPTDGGQYWHYVDGVPTVWEIV